MPTAATLTNNRDIKRGKTSMPGQTLLLDGGPAVNPGSTAFASQSPGPSFGFRYPSHLDRNLAFLAPLFWNQTVSILVAQRSQSRLQL